VKIAGNNEWMKKITEISISFRDVPAMVISGDIAMGQVRNIEQLYSSTRYSVNL
jgi:hypothetical protein